MFAIYTALLRQIMPKTEMSLTCIPVVKLSLN
jgi:hypothetical protein